MAIGGLEPGEMCGLGAEAVSSGWLLATMAAVAAAGLSCKSVDLATGGPGSLLVTNAFAAAYSLLLFFMAFEWLVLHLGGGTVDGVRGVLVSAQPEAAIAGGDRLAGQRICVLMWAYMLQDLLVRFLHDELDPRYVAHHAACLGGLAMVLFAGYHPLYCVALGVSEFTTPVICFFEMVQADKARLGKYFELCGVLLNVLFPLRVGWFCWAFYLWMFEYRKHELLALTCDNVGFACTSVLVAINFSWWVQLLAGSVAALVSTDADADADANAGATTHDNDDHTTPPTGLSQHSSDSTKKEK